ncbi:hypothetical protein ACMD2_19598 [Ananas comosus]|uniref:Uncharacterized protein n=1 Tax=Ananas comosus TaxID=4615 RepID=A0A199UWE6_ANACO|nr:hypothetical protein ACMD2_19598 [Ananas comosus]
METKPSLVDNIKGIMKSGEEFVKGAFLRISDSPNHNPIEILKRLQREAFSDLMKLRDRQDKVESVLSFYKFGKGFPFQEATTRVKAVIDVVAALPYVEDDFLQAMGSLDRTGTKTGINTRFIFETVLRQKDALVAELTTTQQRTAHQSRIFESPLSLTTLMYSANINYWLSLVSIPLGARCANFAQGHNIGGFSSNGPPSFNQYHNCAAGLTVKGINLSASLAELASGPATQQATAGSKCCLATFGQVSYHPIDGLKITLSGLWQIYRSSPRLAKLGSLAIPLGRLREQKPSEVMQNIADNNSAGTIAVMLDSEFDESTKIKGWFEVEKSTARSVRWGMSIFDTPENELGWGLRMGGMGKGQLNHLHLGGFLNFDLGRGAKLQPGVVYVMEGRSHFPALVFESSWSM